MPSGKIALELVRNEDGHIIDIKSFNPYSLRAVSGENKYFQVFNGAVVSELNKSDVVIAKVYHE